MAKINYVALTCLAAAFLSLTACAKKTGPRVVWLKSVEEGKAKATREKKPLIVYYSADWAKSAQQFEDEVLENAEVEKELVKFVAVKIDADVDEETPQTYGVAAFPTTIFYTPRGEEIKRLVGTMPPATFAALLRDVLANKIETVNQLLAREKANPNDLKLAYEVAVMYVETNRPEKATPRLEKIVTADPKNESGLVPGALMHLGFIALMHEQTEEAIAKFNEVLNKYPDAPEAAKCQLYIGDAYQLQDNKENAVNAYRLVTTKYPNTPEAEEAQRKISKLTMFEETVKSFTQK